MKRITSRQNPLVARCRAAARGDLPGAMLLDGPHLVSEAVAAGIRIRTVVVLSEAVDNPDIAELVSRVRADESVVASSAVMSALSTVRSSSLVIALADRPPHRPSRSDRTPPFELVAIDVQDPGNLGAMVRVAEAGGASAMIVAGRSADPFGSKALRGSMGSALRLPIDVIEEPERALRDLHARGCRLVATDPRGGRSFFDIDYTGPVAVLIGGEGPGLPRDLARSADERVTIPMQTPVESLNAAVAAALIVYEARRQRSITPVAPITLTGSAPR